MSSNITLPVGSEQEGQRIDKFLQESLPGMSRSQAQKWIAQGFVRIGEKAAGKNDKLKSGMLVSVELPIPPEELDGEPDWEEILHPTTLPQPQEIPLDIVYEDENILLADKKPGVLCHSAGEWSWDTLISNIQAYLRQSGEWDRLQRYGAAGHCPPHRQGHQRPAGLRKGRRELPRPE